jgi:DNA-binding NarL/FixJ family response regulator
MIRILIVDDHPLIRSGLRALLASAEDMEVVGEAATGEDAVSLAIGLQPDVIAMDLHMPGIGGIEATRRIVEAMSQPRILVLTLFEDDDSVFAALRAGARGYVLKEANEVEVLQAIRMVSSGDAVFSAPIAQRVIDFFSAPRPAALPPFPELTDRERETLGLIAQGLSNAEIAKALTISYKTVRNYISSIFNKLQVADRAQAIVRARQAGLGK